MKDISLQITQVITNWQEAIQFIQLNWDNKPSPERWSPKEIIGHLSDSAHINLERFIRCTYESGFKLVYNQEQWVRVQYYQEIPIKDLLEFWTALNHKISVVLMNYPANALENTCDIGKKETNLKTAAWIGRDYLNHLQHHLQQINNYTS